MLGSWKHAIQLICLYALYIALNAVAFIIKYIFDIPDPFETTKCSH